MVCSATVEPRLARRLQSSMEPRLERDASIEGRTSGRCLYISKWKHARIVL